MVFLFLVVSSCSPHVFGFSALKGFPTLFYSLLKPPGTAGLRTVPHQCRNHSWHCVCLSAELPKIRGLGSVRPEAAVADLSRHRDGSQTLRMWLCG